MGIEKEPVGVLDVGLEDPALNNTTISPKSRWVKIQEIIWDGPRPEEERILVRRLDLFIMYVSSAPIIYS